MVAYARRVLTFIKTLARQERKLAFLLLTNESFGLFQRLGVHVTPVHFYSPVPDLRELEQRPEIWSKELEMPGVDMNDSLQLHTLQQVFERYAPECNFPDRPTGTEYDYNTSNSYFGYVSAAAMHGMIRRYKPSKIFEVGAGHSTYVIANAARLNFSDGVATQVIAIDPYPNKQLTGGFPGLSQLIAERIQDVDLELLCSLKANDILSIDTSHAVRTGGDVTFLYLEVLPRLAAGVLVHVHDIFLPEEYPREWLMRRYFWTEQYLLHAFLMFNNEFEVVWAQKYAELKFPAEYDRAFSQRTDEQENHGSYSFWIRRRSRIGEN